MAGRVNSIVCIVLYTNKKSRKISRPENIKWSLPNTGIALIDSSVKGGRAGKWAPAHWGHEK